MDGGVIDQIKNRLDVVAILSEYIKLTKSGRNYKARCPFHGEKTPSFVVSPERQIWHCFGCGLGGDIFKFVMLLEGVEFGDALRILARKAGVVLQRQDPQIQSQKKRLYEICELSARFFETQLEKSAPGKKIQAYLLERGMKPQTIKDWRLGWAPDEWQSLYDFLRSQGYGENEIAQTGMIIENENSRGFFDRFRGRIMFPIFDIQGQIIAFGGRIFGSNDKDKAKYMNSPQTPLYDKSRVLFGLNKSKTDIRTKDQCVLVEGYMDLIMSWQAGIANVVASSGTALTEEQLKLIGRYTKNLAMAFDSDPAGDTATKRSIALAMQQDFNVRIIMMADKDPADVVKKDPAQWQAAIDNARSVMDFYFASTFAKFSDVKELSPSDKRKIAGLLLPVIKNIASRTEQSEWIRELARRLRVDEKDLIADLQTIKVDPPENLAPPSRSIAPKNSDATSRVLQLEERLLGLCLNYPEHFQNLSLAFQPDFQNQKIAKIFGELKEIMEKNQENDPAANLKSRIPSELKVQIDYFSLKIEQQPVDEISALTELEACIKELKIVKIRQQLKTLGFEINDAQNSGEKLRLKELLESFSRLSAELIELTKNQ